MVVLIAFSRQLRYQRLQLHGLKFSQNLQENTLFLAFFQPKDPHFYMIFPAFSAIREIIRPNTKTILCIHPCDKGTLMSTDTNMPILRLTDRQNRWTDRQINTPHIHHIHHAYTTHTTHTHTHHTHTHTHTHTTHTPHTHTHKCNRRVI